MKTMHPTSELRPLIDSRLHLWRLFCLVGTLILLAGLFYYQVAQGDRYVQLATQNRLRVLRLPRVRGEIYDRSGRPLALNVLTFDLMAYPLDLTDEVKEKLVTAATHAGLALTAEGLDKTIQRRFWAPYRAIPLLNDLTLTQVTTLLNNPSFPSEVFPQNRQRRTYPAGDLTAHVVGYVGEISEAELASSTAEEDYQGGDILGKSGVERSYEKLLAGDPGEQVMEVDARGRPRGALSSEQAQKGLDLRLSIDLGAQQKAKDLIGDRRGSVVVLDVHTGDVVVLYSNPTFDPNPMAWGLTTGEWNALTSDPARPMMNRALAGQYSPGSIWKVITGYAALESGVVTAKTKIRCTGRYTLGNQTYRCWRHWGHGNEDILHALRDSCDVFFYETSQKVGIDRYIADATKFGLNGPLGIDLPGEEKGNLAGPTWKKRRNLGPWYKGDTVNYSIGQGYLLLTPLQMCSMFATVANGGYVVTPKVNADAPVQKRDAGLNKQSLALIRKGLELVTAPGGTGARANAYGVAVAGKTGTVQNAHGDDHAVFAGYAPASAPRYAAVIYLEGGLSGGREAAPLVGQLLAYLTKEEERDGTKPQL